MRANNISHHHVDGSVLLHESPATAFRNPVPSAPTGATSADACLGVFVTATQVRIRGLLGFIRFLLFIRRVRSQLSQTDGLLFVRFRGTRTLTGWRNEEAMRAFRNSGAHLEAMRSVKKIGQAKSASWQAEGTPDWRAAESRLDSVRFRP